MFIQLSLYLQHRMFNVQQPNPQTAPKDQGNQKRLFGEAIKMANLTSSWLDESLKHQGRT